MAVSLSKSPLDRRCPCSSLLQADDYDSTSTSWTRAKIQVDQVDDDHRSFGGSSSQNEVNENGEKVCKSRRSIILWSFIVSVLFHQLHSKPRRVRKIQNKSMIPFSTPKFIIWKRVRGIRHLEMVGWRSCAFSNRDINQICLLQMSNNSSSTPLWQAFAMIWAVDCKWSRVFCIRMGIASTQDMSWRKVAGTFWETNRTTWRWWCQDQLRSRWIWNFGVCHQVKTSVAGQWNQN